MKHWPMTLAAFAALVAVDCAVIFVWRVWR